MTQFHTGTKFSKHRSATQTGARRSAPRVGLRAVLWTALIASGCATAAEPALNESSGADRQSLEDAWWTGPLLAASAATLPRGRFLAEPYVYDSISYARFDERGKRRDTSDAHSFGSTTYLLYGFSDRLTAGLIPRFGYNAPGAGADSSGLRMGDLTMQAQYRLAEFREGRPIPTISLVLQETFPTGKHDQLGSRAANAMGSGAYSTTLALFSQHYFWMPNGRILRARFNVSHTFSQDADVADVSVYGTRDGFRGTARPGESLVVNLAGEYSLTRNWALALDFMYQRDAATHLSGRDVESVGGVERETLVQRRFGPSRRFGVAPAVEYNFNPRVGVIVGARWFPDGRNAEASITPVAAINLVY